MITEKTMADRLAVPARQIQSDVGCEGSVGIHDKRPDYGEMNAPDGYTHIRSIVEAALLLKKGRRVGEVHKTPRCESDFQFIFTEKTPRGSRLEDFCQLGRYEYIDRILEQAVSELHRILSLGYPKEISFRFRDVTLLNRKRDGA